ncbi:MAG: UvrD-helicase domain-containing protein [Clostridiales bacterium]|nr:UvrD-helicase domain-containing protein [Clostridiales bacterium]
MEQQFYQEYPALRRAAIERYFSRINPMQRKAVFHTRGPVLILAGAGSGKTTVIINRIANMIAFGHGHESTFVPAYITEEHADCLRQYLDGGEMDLETLRDCCAVDPVQPWRILAITFTNKAAGELKTRLEHTLGAEAEDIQAATFHSACVRILRREIENIGYNSNFTIYDTDDSLRLIKEACKMLRVDEKNFTPRSLLSMISRAKDKLLNPTQMLAVEPGNFRVEVGARVYEEYQKLLRSANAVDFDDIIVLTVQLFEQCPDILEKYQNRYTYIMVDEYQDTNHAQYRLVSLLADRYRNICVVGDDDQSIYKFRGANIENIMNFEQQFPGALVIRLEQNYRCTKKILDAANGVIEHNTQRKGKTLWTENDEGQPVKIYRASDEGGEALFIANTIMENVAEGARFSDHAILYRMNAQSNSIEKALLRAGVPYRVISGVKFYERKEIKDVMSYLSVINNPNDTVRLGRIINEPKRGIGDATVAACREIADTLGVSMLEVMRTADEYAPLSKKAKPLMAFAAMMDSLSQLAEQNELDLLFDTVLSSTGYLQMLESQLPESQPRIENVQELKSNIMAYVDAAEEPSLAGFLEEVALYTDLDSYDENDDSVVMMTLHSAKGLEYPYVFIAGMEEGIFPGSQVMYFPDEVEEERRLAYVGITRAKKRLYITNAATRMLFGKTGRNAVSRFVGEIPKELTEVVDEMVNRFKDRGISRAYDEARAKKKEVARGFSAGVSAPDAPAEHYTPGDRVRHKVFGEGLVISVTPMGGDSLLEVAFDSVGSKKIMSNFAKLKKL